MRKLFYLSLITIITGFLTIGCSSGGGDNGTPFIRDCWISGNESDVNNGINAPLPYVFNAGATIWIGLLAYDSDGDIDSMTVSGNKSGGGSFGPSTASLSSSVSSSDIILYASLNLTGVAAGDWNFSVYVTDAKGNKSNTVMLAVKIN